MADERQAAPVPPTRGLRTLRQAATECRACPLWRRGTQTVFGEGPRTARVVVVGEQPGDQEDRSGQPFVGPAGRLLDRAFLAAGVKRSELYVTNAVKHFKWEPRGARRLHQKPNAREIEACRPWLEAELESIEPALIVCLGATAVQAVFGRQLPVLKNRGRVMETPLGPPALITLHPSALLRLRDKPDAEQQMEQFVDDLRVIRKNPGARRS